MLRPCRGQFRPAAARELCAASDPENIRSAIRRLYLMTQPYPLSWPARTCFVRNPCSQAVIIADTSNNPLLFLLQLCACIRTSLGFQNHVAYIRWQVTDFLDRQRTLYRFRDGRRKLRCGWRCAGFCLPRSRNARFGHCFIDGFVDGV